MRRKVFCVADITALWSRSKGIGSRPTDICLNNQKFENTVQTIVELNINLECRESHEIEISVDKGDSALRNSVHNTFGGGIATRRSLKT